MFIERPRPISISKPLRAAISRRSVALSIVATSRGGLKAVSRNAERARINRSYTNMVARIGRKTVQNPIYATPGLFSSWSDSAECPHRSCVAVVIVVDERDRLSIGQPGSYWQSMPTVAAYSVLADSADADKKF